MRLHGGRWTVATASPILPGIRHKSEITLGCSNVPHARITTNTSAGCTAIPAAPIKAGNPTASEDAMSKSVSMYKLMLDVAIPTPYSDARDARLT